MLFEFELYEDRPGDALPSVPFRCGLWRDPSPVADDRFRRQFDFIATFADGSHASRHLLRCTGCGQLYLYDFHEEVNLRDGNDPQELTLLAVSSTMPLLGVLNAPTAEWRRLFPRLEVTPGAAGSVARWVTPERTSAPDA